MAYAGYYGADTGGGFNECGVFDAQIVGRMGAGGDTWGNRFTSDKGNGWLGGMAGLAATGTPPHVRAMFSSQRPTTAGMTLWGSGGSNSPGSGSLYANYPGASLLETLTPVLIDGTASGAFGIDGWGSGSAGTGPNGIARRACGQQIDSYYDSGADTEYIFTFNSSGLHRYTNSHAAPIATAVRAIGTTVTTLADATHFPGTSIRSCVTILDTQTAVCLNYDRKGGPATSGGGTLIPTSMFLITTGAADLGHATSGNTTVTDITNTLPGAVTHLYEITHGLDGNFYAACAYAGAYQVGWNGTSLSWTHISAPGGTEQTDLLVSSVHADSAGVVWVGQAGGTTGGSYDNSSTGMVVGHSVVRGNAAHTTWTHPASGSAVKLNEYQAGDGTAATGRIWWLNAQNIVLSQPAHDVSMIRVSPFDDNHISIWGRSGSWQSRDGGASWYPAVNGMNGSDLSGTAGLCKTTGPTAVSACDSDWKETHTTDAFKTAIKGASYSGGGIALPTTGSKTITGDDGHSYQFIPATTGNPAQVKRDGVNIEDDAYRGAIVAPASACIDSAGNVYTLQNGGGVFVLNSSGGTTGTKPTVSAANETGITATTATLNGTVNPSGADTTYQFQYGLTSGYGTNSPASPSDIGAGTSNQAVSANLTGLTANTTYHWRLQATNANGTTNSPDQTFTTSAAAVAPSVTESAADGIDAADATLHGTVNPNGQATTYQFEYGTTTGYGSVSPASAASAGSGTAPVAVSAALTGLSATTTYHWRLNATNATGTTHGADQTFTTGAGVVVPAVTPQNETGITSSGATLNASINPGGASTNYHFEYGLTTGYGTSTVVQTLPAGNVAQAVSAVISGLAANTTYHWRVVAVNSAGTTNSADQSFVTAAAAAKPTVTESAADAIDQSHATLHGTVNPNGQATTYQFQYGLTTGYGSTSPASPASAGAGSSPVTVTPAVLSGLAPATTYHWRLQAINPTGTTNGTDQTFTTNQATGTPGTPFGLPDTSYGLVNRACSGDYFPTIDTQAHANTLAQANDLIKTNIDQAISSSGNITTDKLNGFASGMLIANSQFLIIPYCKGCEINEGVSFYPNDFYAHSGSWPGGPKILAFGNSIYVGQPDGGSSTFNDPRGWTATSFKDQRARDSWSIVAKYNAVNGANTLNGVYYDSIGTGTFKNPPQIDPTTGAAYTKASWFADEMHMPDRAAALRPKSSDILFANFLKNGDAYFPTNSSTSSSIPFAHTDGGFAETWLRPNNSDASSFPALSSWQNDINMVIDANLNQKKCIWVCVNLLNSVAGGSATSTAINSFTAAAIEQWHRFAIASYMVARRNATWFEIVMNYVPTGKVTLPWNEDHPYYHIDTGPPIDNAADAAHSTFGPTYGRRFQNALALVNPTGSSVAPVADRNYTDPITGTKYPTGSTITLQPNTGLILTVDQASGGPPSLTVISPLDGSTASTSSQTILAQASSPNQIKQVRARVNGGAWTDLTTTSDFPIQFPLIFTTAATSNDYEGTVTLATGANAIDVQAIDNSGSSQTTTQTVHVSLGAAPVNTVAPLIELSPGGGGAITTCQVGDVLVVSNGTWTGSTPITYTYQGLRDGAPNGVTASTYTVQAGDLNHTLDWNVTATNSVGAQSQTSSDPVAVVSVSITPPTVTNLSASPLTPLSTTLHATINPNGDAVSDYHFEYGLTTSYGSVTPSGTLPLGTANVRVNAPITGLLPSTTYHYRAVATNGGGTTPSTDHTFTTPAVSAPLCTTAAVTNITTTSAILNGQVNPQGSAVSDYHFEYGTTTGYGTSVPVPSGTLPSGTSGVNVSAGISGLTPGTTYHFRLVATNAGGTGASADATFPVPSTPPPPPPPPPASTTPTSTLFTIVIMTQQND